MKALSIRQPWAWAILCAGKRIENRERADGRMPSFCTYRGPLLIHASAGCTEQEHDDASLWMYSNRLAGRRLPGSGDRYVLPDKPIVPERRELRRGGIVGVCTVVGHVVPGTSGQARVHRGAGSYDPHPGEDLRWHAPGSYGLILADVRALPFMAFKGSLGLFDVPGPTPEATIEIARREGWLRL